MATGLPHGVGMEEVIVGTAAQVLQLLLDRSRIIHPPTFSMLAARGIR